MRGARALEQARSLGKRYIYFWVDGIHVQARLEDTAQCLLIIIGATPEGRKERLLGHGLPLAQGEANKHRRDNQKD